MLRSADPRQTLWPNPRPNLPVTRPVGQPTQRRAKWHKQARRCAHRLFTGSTLSEPNKGQSGFGEIRASSCCEEVVMQILTAAHADALDAVHVDPQHHNVLFENDQVRVVRWVVAGGDKTLHHSHPDNLNICLTDYNGRVTAPNSTPYKVEAKAGSVTWRQAGSHAVENLTDQPMAGILVEPKQPASSRPPGSPDPVAVDPEHHKIEFENEQIRVLRERRDPGDLPLHGHPDCVQVLLTDVNVMLTTAGGKTQTVTGKAGEVRWRTATQHQGVIPLGKPVEQLLIEMKGKPAGH